MQHMITELLIWIQLLLRSFSPPAAEQKLGLLHIHTIWDVLGPFQIGTREATWGADPLQAWGGFQSQSFDANKTFTSSLGVDGIVRWTQHYNKEYIALNDSAVAKVDVSYPSIDWATLRSYYGWAALQYQAWARTGFNVAGEEQQTILVYTDGILEFCIDDNCYFGGDFYTYRRAPLVVHLELGQHRLDVRLIRDVRASGGSGEPNAQFTIKLEVVSQNLHVGVGSMLLPEVLENYGLASTYGSVPIRNTGLETVRVFSIEPLNNTIGLEMVHEHPLLVVKGQSRSIAFRIHTKDLSIKALCFLVVYSIGDSTQIRHSRIETVHFQARRIDEPHRYTFLHPSNTVSYAILKAPGAMNNKINSGGKKFPVLLNLHGAGLEADSEQVRHMLDGVEDLPAWTIFPTGGTAWSGDDWHAWGFADVKAAIAAVPNWIERHCKASSYCEGSRVVFDKLYVTGHSNGGQGTWYALTHEPDRVMAAGIVSGYSSIQGYVPYTFWNEMDPRIWLTLQTSLTSYRHELLVDNFAGVSQIELQHGGDDDNVPPFHSRRMSQLISLTESRSNYTELSGKGHWFDGVMITPALRRIYDKISTADDREQSVLPQSFRTVFPNSGDMGSRGGIFVDQLQSPDALGSIEVKRIGDDKSWVLRTSNILRFHFSTSHYQGKIPMRIVVDGKELEVHISHGRSFWYIKDLEGCWKATSDENWKSVSQRYGAQLGALDAFLRTRGPVAVQYLSTSLFETALQIANNLYQYFAADCSIMGIAGDLRGHTGNVVIIGKGPDLSPSVQSWHPIQIMDNGITVRDYAGVVHRYPSEPGIGVIFLSPRPKESLTVNIWGYDTAGLAQAARLLPLLTGVGQPDFVIVTRRCSWQGAAGVLASGFFDHAWNVSAASFLK